LIVFSASFAALPSLPFMSSLTTARRSPLASFADSPIAASPWIAASFTESSLSPFISFTSADTASFGSGSIMPTAFAAAARTPASLSSSAFIMSGTAEATSDFWICPILPNSVSAAAFALASLVVRSVSMCFGASFTFTSAATSPEKATRAAVSPATAAADR
jgi:hypothetical protein